jgi:hypothetical protein
MLRLTKYNYDDVPKGHTLGHCLSAARATDIQYTVATTQSPGQKKTYTTHLEALECLYTFAPPVKYTGYLTPDRPSWLLFLGRHTLQKVVRIGDVVYVDHSGFYAGGVVVEVLPPLREDFCHGRLYSARATSRGICQTRLVQRRICAQSQKRLRWGTGSETGPLFIQENNLRIFHVMHKQRNREKALEGRGSGRKCREPSATAELWSFDRTGVHEAWH